MEEAMVLSGKQAEAEPGEADLKTYPYRMLEQKPTTKPGSATTPPHENTYFFKKFESMKVGKEMTGLNGHWTERRLKSKMEECLDASFPK